MKAAFLKKGRAGSIDYTNSKSSSFALHHCRLKEMASLVNNNLFLPESSKRRE